jgi:hypothetical protein
MDHLNYARALEIHAGNATRSTVWEHNEDIPEDYTYQINQDELDDRKFLSTELIIGLGR